MRSKGNRWMAAALGCLLFLCALPCPVTAEDCFILDVDALDMNQLNSNDYVAENLMSRAKGLCVQKYISDSSELAEPVRLTIMRMDTETLLMDKDYGYQSKSFDSGVIYLNYSGSGVIPYLVTLYLGNTVYAMPFMQLQPRLELNSACTYGLRLMDLGLSADWLMGTMLDLNQLRSTGYAALDVCASNAYIIGQAVVQMQNEALCVQLNLNQSANVDVLAMSLYILTDCAAVTSDPSYGGYPTAGLGQWVDVAGASSAFLYMPMQVSYDPAGLNTFSYDPNGGAAQNQLALWNQNRSGAPLGENGAALPAQDITPTADPFMETWPVVPEEAAWPEATAAPDTFTPDAQETVPDAFFAEDGTVLPEPAPDGAVVLPAPTAEPTALPQPNGNAGFGG